MNSVQVSGTFSSPPEPAENGIRFQLKTRYPVKGESSPGAMMVPCVVFDCTSDQRNILLGSNHRKFRTEITGRLVRSVFENEYGEIVTGIEVVANPNGLMLQRIR